MESLFAQSVEDLNGMRHFTRSELAILRSVDKAAEEMAVGEFEHYIRHEVNLDAIDIAKRHGLLGIPIKKEYWHSGI